MKQYIVNKVNMSLTKHISDRWVNSPDLGL